MINFARISKILKYLGVSFVYGGNLNSIITYKLLCIVLGTAYTTHLLFLLKFTLVLTICIKTFLSVGKNLKVLFLRTIILLNILNILTIFELI